MNTMWFVEYKVPSMTGDKVHRAGPYSGANPFDSEVQSQFNDISTYVGVEDAKVVPASWVEAS